MVVQLHFEGNEGCPVLLMLSMAINAIKSLMFNWSYGKCSCNPQAPPINVVLMGKRLWGAEAAL